MYEPGGYRGAAAEVEAELLQPGDVGMGLEQVDETVLAVVGQLQGVNLGI